MLDRSPASDLNALKNYVNASSKFSAAQKTQITNSANAIIAGYGNPC